MNICIDCQLATSHTCPWAKDRKPVRGWKATRTALHHHGCDDTHSYDISYCPLFQLDERAQKILHVRKKKRRASMYSVAVAAKEEPGYVANIIIRYGDKQKGFVYICAR